MTASASAILEFPSIAVAPANDRRILILAPTANDAGVTAAILAKADLASKICRDMKELCSEIILGCGAIILAEETLGNPFIQNLISILSEQASWSDIPIVLVTSGGEASQIQLRRLNTLGPVGNVTLLERPFRQSTLISTLEVALRARQRQYEARDFVEQLKRAHDEATTASQAKDRFLAALSHELRTPLNPALLIASEFAFDKQLPDDVRENFEIIRKNIELEARLIDDLLDLTRVTSGKLVLRMEILDAHQILADAMDKVRAEIQRKNIQLRLKLNAPHCAINGDAVRLQQVFWNVLTNAVKFTPHDGTITVETSNADNRDEPQLCIRVTDSGIGMTAEEASRVFQPFAQGDHAGNGGSHRFGGLGLGLAIARNLVQLHSGTIAVKSVGRNQGSTFIITVPLVTENSNGSLPACAN